MEPVATLTLNPSIDTACEAEEVFPTRKIRTSGERYDPGGGGINVARVLARFGHRVETIYLSGGVTGALLDELLELPGIERHRLPIAEHTRMSLTVFERKTGQEYRFVPEGPLLGEAEWQAALDHCAALPGGWLVASGSLPRGVPDDFYARLAARCTGRGLRLALDSSGAGLARAVEAGGLALIKPNRDEFEALCGKTFPTRTAIGEAALELVHAGKAALVAVSLGADGAILAHAGGVLDHPGLAIEARSATGAGDSFMAGLVADLASGKAVPAAFRRALASGSAALVDPGTQLCRPEKVAELLAAMD